MAKRRRLTPASPAFLEGEARPDSLSGGAAGFGPDGPPAPSRPPIAQVAGDTSAAAALGELSEMVGRARAEGRLIQPLPLAEVDVAHLVRDRLETEEEELQSLMASLRSRGQQTPVEVVDRGEARTPRYGLISGWRRLAALSRLSAENPRFGTVLALVRTPGTASEAYVAMVEENEIRVSLSFYERARIVVKALEQGVYDDARTALQTLFANVPRAKRSKIKSFMALVEALDGALVFPTAIGERLGLGLARALEEDPALGARLRAALEADPATVPEAELERLGRALDGQGVAPDAGASPEVSPPPADSLADPAAEQREPPREAVAETPSPTSVESRYDPETGSIVLTGPGVTPALRAALDRWLRARGASGGVSPEMFRTRNNGSA